MKIEKGKVGLLHFTLTDGNGNQIDASADEPLTYLHGYQNLMPTLENALQNKQEGDKFQCTIPAAEGYGELDEKLIQSDVPKTAFEGVEQLEVGMRFQVQSGEEVHVVRITEVAEETVTVDANHELAGIDLVFDVEVVGVRDATEDELANGHTHAASEQGGCCSSSDCCSK